MATIGQGPSSTDGVTVRSADNINGADPSNAPVKRGYGDGNSYSYTDGEGERENSTQSSPNKPSLDIPGADGDVDEGFSELGQQNKSGEEGSVLGGLSAALNKRLSTPFGESSDFMGESEFDVQTKDVFSGLLSPLGQAVGVEKNPEKFPAIFSYSARLDENLDDGSKVNTVYDMYKDITSRYSAIEEIPSELKVDLDTTIKNFSQKALSADPVLDIDTATTMLMEIQTKLQNNRIKFDQEQIHLNQAQMDITHKKQMTKIKESIEKASEAKKSALISKIFGWIALAFVAIITAVTCVLTGGVAAGLMVAALAIMVTMQVSQECKSTWMMDIFGDSKEGKIGAMVFWSTLIIALSLGAAAAPGAAGAGSAAAGTATNMSTAGTTGATVSATAANTAATTAGLTARTTSILTKISKLCQVANGAAMIGDGAATIVNTSYTYEADMLRAEAHELKAFMLRNQQAIEDITEALASAIDELQAGYSVFTGILKANHDTKSFILGKMKA
ncbi:hypothetical protein ACH42_06460 [Endozoicomonas sp. (ex Bugula neritina AB1)]|nr:hypothetical protein ACH42_06460 [Endozoicomonas sp. (ex Bugula neritina AB1)]